VHRTFASGTIVYQEVQTPTTTTGGQFSMRIGTGVVSFGTFGAIEWPIYPHYLQIEIDPTGGTAFTDMGTTQLVSVPYALPHETTDALSGSTGRIARCTAADAVGSSSITESAGQIGINDTSPSY